MKEGSPAAPKNNLQELTSLFLKLGVTAFGGPAAHIAMMQQEVVDRRKWMDHAHFLDLIGATNLIPGPNSTELAIHIGYERGGWRGLLLAGACFILPAVLITGVIAWLYQQYGQLPQVTPFTYGIRPAIISIILGATWPIARRALKLGGGPQGPGVQVAAASSSLELGILGLLVLAATLMGVDEIYAMFGAGLVTLLLFALRRSRNTVRSLFPFLQISSPAAAFQVKIFFTFLKIGAILYGSGYVLFAFLDKELVAKGLLTKHQLTDAIAIGQFTPGPVFSSVTFIGWQMNGLSGAALATLAIFLPSFVFVALSHPLIPRMRRSGLFSAFLDGVNISAVAIILTVCISLGRETISDWRTILLALISLAVVFRFPRLNSFWVVVGGSLLGYFLSLIQP